MKRTMVTGASGFIGKATVAALLQRGIEVHAVSRKPPRETNDCVWHTADLLEPETPRHLVRSIAPDSILHLAWTVEHGKFWTAPENLTWVAASLNLARAAADHSVKRFVATGTCFEYDWPLHGDCDEATTPIKPSTLYGVSKDATRRLLDAYFLQTKIPFAWARLFFLYGPDEGPARLIPGIARALAQGEKAACLNGGAVRDFMDVRDAGAALALLALSAETGCFNVASGQATRIADAVALLGRISGRPDLLTIETPADYKGDPPRIVADIRKLRNLAGFQGVRTLEQGLEEAFKYWKEKALHATHP